jgi:hypothetical protein
MSGLGQYLREQGLACAEDTDGQNIACSVDNLTETLRARRKPGHGSFRISTVFGKQKFNSEYYKNRWSAETLPLLR